MMILVVFRAELLSQISLHSGSALWLEASAVCVKREVLPFRSPIADVNEFLRFIRWIS